MRAHFNIGSNAGDRVGVIAEAIAKLRGLSEGDFRVSGAVESRPWGFDSSNPFINTGVSFECSLAPLCLLEEAERIEREIVARRVKANPAYAEFASHRNADGTYRDRLLDIDFICYGDLRVEMPRLTLPHPRASLRDFVMKPLCEIDPDMERMFM